MRNTLLAFSSAILLLTSALSSRADETVILHGVDFVSCEVDGTGGNNINNTSFLPMPPSLSDPNGNNNAEIFVWNCSGFNEYYYFTGPDADAYFGYSGSPDAWYDGGGTLANVTWNPGRGMILDVPVGAPVAITLYGTPVATPSVPPTNYCGCNLYSLIGPQDPSSSTYQGVTGMAPADGAQVYRHIAGQPIYPFQSPNYTVFTYNNGLWSPGDPTLPTTNAEAAIYYVPCATNPCITMSCTGDKTVPCGTIWNFDAPTNIVDSCCTNYLVNFTTVTNSFGCPLVVVRTWTISDVCGNSNSCSQTVTVSSAPTINCPTNKTIPCTASVIFNPPIIITNACCGTNILVSIYGSDVVTNFGTCSYATTRTWQITDCCGDTNFCHQTITVTNKPPIISCIPDKTIPCSSVLIFNPPHITPFCCSNITIIPFGNDVTNNLGPCSYSVTRTWLVTDCCSLTNFCHQTVTVADTNPPALQCPSNIVVTACASVPVFYSATAVDDCCTNVTVTFTPPSGSPFGPGTVTTVHCVATDCCSNSTSCDFTVTVNPSTSTNCCCDNCNPPYPICYTNIIRIGLNYLVNHLCQGTNNTLDDILQGIPDGTILYKWNVNSQGYDPVGYYDSGSGGWLDAFTFNPSTATLKAGEAFVLDNPGPQFTLTICGCDANCPLPCLPPTNGMVLVGRFDVGTAAWTNLSSCPPECGTEVLIWNPLTQSFSTNVYRNGAWTPQDPILGVGQSAFVLLIPCTNCIDMTCVGDKTVPCGTFWSFDAPSNIVDNCCSNFSLTFTTATNSPNCPLVVTRTWWVIDTCGNSNFCQQTITVTNTPAIISCNPDKTISCTSALIFDPPTATNGCCTNISISIYGTDVVTNFGPCTHSVTRTWLIADCCSSNFCHQTVTVVDNTPPLINCVTNKTVLCTSNWSFDMPTASDACCTNVTISVLSTVTISNCPTVIRRTWVATDCCNNTNTCSQTVTVLSCVPPPDGMVGWWPGDGNGNDIFGGNNGSLLGGATFTAGMVDQAFNFTSSGQSVQVPTAPALDITGAISVDAWINPSTTAVNLAILNKATAGTPDGYYFDLYQGKVRFLVGNAGVTGLGTYFTSTQVLPVNQWTHVAATYDGALIRLYINGVQVNTMAFSDPFPGPNGQPLLIGNSSSGAEYFLGAVDEVELFNRVIGPTEVAAIYAAGPAGKCKVPVLVCATNKVVPCGNTWSFDPPTVTPPCGNTNYALTVSQTVTNGNCPLVVTRTWLFVDGCGHSNTCSQTVTLTGTPSIITCSPNKTIPCTGTLVFNPPTVTNACCTNIFINIFGSDVTNHLGTCAYTVTRSWLIVDCCSTNACSQTITVTNSPPIINCSLNKTIPCTSALVFDPPTVTNTCCTNVLIIIYGSDVVTNLGPCAHATTRTWLITDCCGDTNFCQQTITVTNTGPTINCNPDKTIPCTTNLVFNPPGVTNGCCTNVVISIFGLDVTNILGPCSYSVTRNWRIVDCCSTNLCQQKITVTNTPMVVNCPVDKIIPCNSNVVFDLPQVVISCRTNAITVISNLTSIIGPCTNVFTRYWRITDGCSTNICHQSVTVTHPPPLLSGTIARTNPCGTALTWTTPVAVDPCCSTNLTVKVLRTVTNSFNPLIVTRTWVATNCCGLTNSFSEKITMSQDPPVNDDCSGAIQLTAGPGLCGSTLCATPSMVGSLSPAPCGSSLHSPDVWYKYTSECGGNVTFDTCSTNCTGTANLDTVLSVYTGICGSLIQVPGQPSCNDNSCGSQSKVTLSNLTACTTYYIRVAGHNNAIGDFRIKVTETFTTPANNACANATVVGNGQFPFSNCNATTDGPNTGTNCPSFNDVWFRYTAPCSGQMWVETCNSCFGTVLSVYTGTCSSLNLVACNTQATQGRCAGSQNSFVQFAVTSGQTYRIRVGSAVLGVTGSGFLTVNGPYPTLGTCPPNVPCPANGWRYFNIVGNGNNIPWSWSIQAPCCANVQVTNVPGVSGSVAALATAFVNSINGAGCPGLRAQTSFTGAMPGRIRICMSCTNWVFRVGGVGTPEQNQCVVPYSANLGPSGPCVFNPEMFELETAGYDLNNNDVDDAIDILDGTSLDLDQDGIPDEVQSCVLPVFTDYPGSQVVPPGTNITFTANATGTGPLTYFWYLNGTALVDNTNVMGSTSNILTILAVGTENLGEYNVVVSNACGVDISPPAELSVPSVLSPIIAGQDSGNGSFQFSFPTQLGVSYVVEYTEDLTSPDWTPLETVEGDGDARSAVDPSPDAPKRFYRVRSIDPP